MAAPTPERGSQTKGEGALVDNEAVYPAQTKQLGSSQQAVRDGDF
jgi:hypothetical protein